MLRGAILFNYNFHEDATDEGDCSSLEADEEGTLDDAINGGVTDPDENDNTPDSGGNIPALSGDTDS